jgi:hypothetical protein
VEHRLQRARQGFRVVLAEMQSAAFVAALGAADDQVGGHDQVAQFDQVVADPEMRVEVVDFAVQQADPVLRARCRRLVVRTMPT